MSEIPEGFCQCGCGGRTGIYPKTRLARGEIKGKYQKCLRGHRSRIGPKSHDRPGYAVWANMIQRCTNPKHPQYKDYGGRGITVSDEWRSFDRFFSDMGAPPSGKTLERQNNDKGYSAANCTWATRSAQNANKRSNVKITFGGRTLNMKEWARELGVYPAAIRYRVMRGWSAEEIITKPFRTWR